MGAMNKLRENTGVILWILVLSFGIIWTLQDSNVFDTPNRPERNAAVVNGNKVSTQRYQNAVEQQRKQFRQQTQRDITPRMEELIRKQAYNQLVNNTLLEQEMKRLGITVTDAEIKNMVFGENPHRIIRQQFADSTGQINYQLLQNMAQNPQASPQFLRLEQFLEEQRRRDKMNSLIQSTVYVSEEDVEEYHWRQNVSASVKYVAQRYASVSDDSISVTESDLQSYYDNNKEDFKRKKTLTLDYVTLSKTPTAEDTAAVLSDLKKLRGEFKAAENDSLFLEQNASEWSFTDDYATPDELDESVSSAIYKNPTAGRIAGPVAGGSFAHLVKIRDLKPADGSYIRASHILLKSEEDDPALRERLSAIRDSVESGTASFAAMARTHSEDQSASEGGDLGWFGEGRMVPAFEEAAFDADPGSLVGSIKSKFGYHLIRVHQRTTKKVQIADLAFSLKPSQSTLSEKKSTLENVAFYASDNSSFEAEAERENLTIQQVQAQADQKSVPGIGQSRALPRFMEEAEEGELSDVFELDDKFALVKVTEVKPEGYRPFEDVKAQIRPQVVKQKKKAVLSRRMDAALQSNSFQALPQVLGTQMRTQSNLSFTAESVPGVGADPTFTGTVFGLDESKTSGVKEGENAAFVVRVTAMNTPPELTASKRQEIRQTLREERRKQVSNQWLAALKEDATIKDQRQLQ
ncbi:MAG: peptidylprolyl isomerase [Bacteroidetes bacterium SW_9_63_38]|nr:MAG: peptidylprolyl isomerase [Bacteroidetes bacterium SW_9_63_38]